MANEKILQTRIQQKFDTYVAWTTANPILLKGELAIVEVPSNTGTVASEPVLMFKVGDGATAFNNLPWVAGLAADVYAWAKSANKPAYSASEITGMGEYIANYVDETLGISVDTNTVYKVELTTDKKGFVLSSQNKGETAWAEVASLSFVEVFESAGAAAAVDTKLTAEVTRATEAEAKVLADANAYTDAQITEKAYNDSEVRQLIADEATVARTAEKVNADAIAVLNGAGEGSVDKKITDAFNKFATDVTDDDVVNSYKELIDYASSHGAEFTELVGTVTKNTNDIAAEVTRATEAETALGARVTALEGIDHNAYKAYADQAEADAIAAASTALNEVKTTLQTDINNRVEKVNGKGLSTNDFSTEEKTKLEGIEANAQANKVESIKVNGVVQTIAGDKSVDLVIKNNIADLEQTENTYVIFNCGSATVNV